MNARFRLPANMSIVIWIAATVSPSGERRAQAATSSRVGTIDGGVPHHIRVDGSGRSRIPASSALVDAAMAFASTPH